MSDDSITGEIIFEGNRNNASNLFSGIIDGDEPGNNTEEPSTGVSVGVKFNNYPEKKNYEDNTFDFCINNGMLNQKRIKALEYFKNLDNYYLGSSIQESLNLENIKFSLTKSKNYVPKYLVTKYEIPPNTTQEFLYYKIKMADNIYCTYIDKSFGLDKIVYKIPSNSNNNTS